MQQDMQIPAAQHNHNEVSITNDITNDITNNCNEKSRVPELTDIEKQKEYRKEEIPRKPNSTKCLVYFGFVFHILFHILSLITSIIAFALAAADYSKCDPGTIIHLSVWLIIYGAVRSPTIILLFVLCVCVRDSKRKNISKQLRIGILFCILIILIVFDIVWAVVGSVELFTYGSSCFIASNQVILNNILYPLIIEYMSIVVVSIHIVVKIWDKHWGWWLMSKYFT